MKLVVWNCKMALQRKRQRIYDMSPDVAVIPECSRDCIELCMTEGFDGRWFGDNSRKGLGILVAEPWKILRHERPKQKWVAPIWLTGPSNLLLIAVWTTRVGRKTERNYIGQFYEAVTSNPAWFNGEQAVLCGDFNSNRIWDKKRQVGNHSEVVRYLGDRGIFSAYHHFFSEEQGAETRPTHFLYHEKERSYHIDYVFAPGDWLSRIVQFNVGTHAEWGALSDHVPLVVEFDLGGAGHGATEEIEHASRSRRSVQARLSARRS